MKEQDEKTINLNENECIIGKYHRSIPTDIHPCYFDTMSTYACDINKIGRVSHGHGNIIKDTDYKGFEVGEITVLPNIMPINNRIIGYNMFEQWKKYIGHDVEDEHLIDCPPIQNVAIVKYSNIGSVDLFQTLSHDDCVKLAQYNNKQKYYKRCFNRQKLYETKVKKGRTKRNSKFNKPYMELIEEMFVKGGSFQILTNITPISRSLVRFNERGMSEIEVEFDGQVSDNVMDKVKEIYAYSGPSITTEKKPYCSSVSVEDKL